MAESKDNTVLKTFEFKLRENRTFIESCERTLDGCRFLYNCALEQRINLYAQTGKGIGFVEQCRQLTDARADLPEVAAVYRDIQTDVLKRLDKAFAVGVLPDQLPSFADDAIDGAHQPGRLAQSVEQRHDGHFVRRRDVSAAKPHGTHAADGVRQVVGRNFDRQVSPIEAVPRERLFDHELRRIAGDRLSEKYANLLQGGVMHEGKAG